MQCRRLDPEIHDLALAPQADDVLVAQRHPIGGSIFYLGIQDVVTDEAGRSLGLAMAVVQTSDTSPGAKQAVWDNWQRTHSEKAVSRVRARTENHGDRAL